MNPRPTVGDKVFVVSVGHRRGPARDEQPLVPATVSKVGTKYFSIETDAPHNFTATFRLGDWRERTEYEPLHYLYSSPQERADEIERRRVWEFLRRIFNCGLGSTDHSLTLRLETLQDIENLIVNEKDVPQ